MTDGQRRGLYRRNPRLEALLDELNALLAPVEERILERWRAPAHPPVLIVGVPRSGTTLFMQWLAQSGLFAYPSNLMARFYRAPYVGARIQQLLTDPDYAFRDELVDLQSGAAGYRSDLGKTLGALAPNEFWYFWRRFFPEPHEDWSTAPRSPTAPARFLRELAALEAVFSRPLAMKAMIANWNIPMLDRLFERAVFVHVRRDPLYNAQSLLEARERFFGDRRRWYSFKPPGFHDLEALAPLEQVAGQVALTCRAVEEGLARIDENRRLDVEYEAFCADPGATFAALRRRLAGQGVDAPPDYRGPRAFGAANTWRLPQADRARLRNALEAFTASA